MLRKWKIPVIVFCVCIFALVTCKKKYDSPADVPDKGYLVVEGFINNGGAVTTINLSRTTVFSNNNIVRERKAVVTIEADNNISWPLTETSAGSYTSAPLVLDPVRKYRIHIKTQNGAQYVSAYTAVRSTPPIDSITWDRDEQKGVRFFVNSHDPQNKTRYYLWKYQETWEYHSPSEANLKFLYGSSGKIIKAVFIYPSQWIDSSQLICWHYDTSKNIILSSSEKLSQDIISKASLGLTIPYSSQKIGILYSLNVKQYAVSKDAYQFYQLMQKNTEQLGSIFDAQPSEISGNIHSLTDPNEIVIGFVEVTQETEKRIFIYKSEVPDWKYENLCTTGSEEVKNDSLNLNKAVDSFPTFVPTIPNYFLPFDMNGLPTFVVLSDQYCVDCTLQGGTNKKPVFWPK